MENNFIAIESIVICTCEFPTGFLYYVCLKMNIFPSHILHQKKTKYKILNPNDRYGERSR